jgi:hypothetical protein
MKIKTREGELECFPIDNLMEKDKADLLMSVFLGGSVGRNNDEFFLTREYKFNPNDDYYVEDEEGNVYSLPKNYIK